MYPTTRDFLDALTTAGEVRRVAEPTNPILGVTALVERERTSRAPKLPSAATRVTDPRFHTLGGSALLIENVQGSDWPVLINQFGSYHRMEMALGCHDDGGHTPGGLEALAQVIAGLTKPEPPRSLGEMVAKARELLPLLRIPPKRRRGSGLCQQVVIPQEKVDLRRLPMIRCWPMDGDFAALGYPAGVNDGVPGLGRGPEWARNFRGRYITLAGIHTVHADDRDDPKPRSHNIGMYRVQLLGEKTLAMHWHMHHDGARHWRSWKKLGKPMPVAIVLGGESVMPYAATAPLPPGISELLLAGFLNTGGIEMVRGKTVPLWVPANAEIVIEGYVSHEAGMVGYDPRDPNPGPIGPGAVFEGPFGDHTGFYSLPDRYPLLTVTAITHRHDPIYPTTVVGLPPQEDYFLGKATERLFLPLLKTIVHDIEDYDLPMYGAFHNAAHVKIAKEYPLQGRRVMHSVWGAGQMAWTKTICVVDQNVDVHDATAVLRAVGEHCHPARDVAVVEGPLDILDHAAPYLGAGGKIGFDATPKGSAERMGGPEIGDAPAPADAGRVVAGVRAINGVLDAACPEALGGRWLMVSVNKSLAAAEAGTGVDVDRVAGDLRRAVAGAGDGVRYAIIVGAGVSLASVDEPLFHWCANFDPRRDTLLEGELMIFDATPKSPREARHGLPTRAYPPILTLEQSAAGDLRGPSTLP